MKQLIRYFHPLERVRRTRARYLSSLKLPNMLANLVEQPCPETNQRAQDIDYIVLDFETTGFDSEQDRILSMGWVIIRQNRIDLASAQHIYINGNSQIKPETAVINHITPQMLAGGMSIHDAMMRFFSATEGRVIVAHGCVIEANFLNHYLKQTYHLPDLPLLWIDTLCIEKKLARNIHQDDSIDLTLSGARRRYHLPEYTGHNALADAVSTAELLLAIQKRIRRDGSLKFGQLYKLSH